MRICTKKGKYCHALLSWSKPFLLTHLAPLLWFISVLQRVSFIGGRDTASLTMG